MQQDPWKTDYVKFAKLIGINERTLRDWLRDGVFEFERAGRDRQPGVDFDDVDLEFARRLHAFVKDPATRGRCRRLHAAAIVAGVVEEPHVWDTRQSAVPPEVYEWLARHR